MKEIESVCPECGKKNIFYLSSNAEQLADFENELEKEPYNPNLKYIVEDFKSRPNQKAICSECLENPVNCACGCDYYIEDSKNWTEIKNIIDLFS